VLLTLASLFCAATTAYSLIWMVHVHHVIALGTDVRWTANHEAEVRDVESRTLAWQAAFRPGDRIVAVNGERLDNPSPFYGYPFYKAVMLGRKGDIVRVTVLRPGRAGELTLRPPLVSFGSLSGLRGLAAQATNFYPLFFLIVALIVLSLRLEDPNAWLLALLFAGFIGAAPLFEGSINPHLRGLATWYKVTFGTVVPGIFCYFFLTFPVPSPIDSRWPRLKSVLLFLSATYSIPLGLACLLAGGLFPYYSLFGWVSRKPLAWPLILYTLGLYSLGFVSLVWNSLRPATSEARRRTRVIVWGTLVGFGPLFAIFAASFLANIPIWEIPFWVLVLGIISLALMPLSFAYAVVKHRVLEIPVLLKRSARYLIVQRGFVVLTVLVTSAAILLFITIFNRFFHAYREHALPVGMGVGIAFGAISAVVALHVLPRINKRIDRAFFRSAYDARQVLEDLAQKTRKATERDELAALLESEINQALHPTSMAIYLEDGDGRLSLQRSGLQSGLEPFLLPDAPLLQELARRGGPLEVTPLGDGDGPGPSILGSIRQECLVPMLGSDGRLTGVIGLGPRLSEEPYSGEDRRLLASVASHTGIALENIRLAEVIAERIEVERRAAQEMEFARQVQARLFPQKLPPLATMEYAGCCLQARQVGGDYYDFLSLGSGRMGIVLADIAGKGISGALLMANLQANLRSQYAVALENLPQLLESVNQLFFESTDDRSYATLFFADYHDPRRRLRYVNCGHLPPLLLRADGGMERLSATATVLGLFEKWECAVAESELAPGDILVLYSDGVTEAASAAGEEFGEGRLLDTLKGHSLLPAGPLLQAVVGAVQQFVGGEQQDDITLVIARSLP
jgi:sigma-B regulation protein RsbU (phosphoserine phosphatase)